MKKNILLTSILLVIGCYFAIAQSPPQAFKYQSIVRSINGNPMANASIRILATIHVNSVTGPVLYQESHNVTTNQFGLINLEIGNGMVESGTFSAISWGVGTNWMEIQADFGNGLLAMGTSQLLSVPYALNCGNGIVGPIGATGPQGSICLTGLTGLTGANGIQGITGDSGTTGPQGSIGITGLTGANGIQGVKGDSVKLVRKAQLV